MTYETAKKLKNAGFPQTVKAGSKVFYQDKVYIHLGGGHNGDEGLYAEQSFTCCLDEYNKEDSDLDINSSILNIKDSLVVLNPTLFEIIEACGEDFGSLELGNWIYDEKGESFWYAHSTKKTVRKGGAKQSNGVIGKGPTPEVAVAALWLTLNKK